MRQLIEFHCKSLPIEDPHYLSSLQLSEVIEEAYTRYIIDT